VVRGDDSCGWCRVRTAHHQKEFQRTRGRIPGWNSCLLLVIRFLQNIFRCSTTARRTLRALLSNHETFSSFYEQQQQHRTQQATGPTKHYFFILSSLIIMDLGAQISQMSPDQRQALMAQAQQEANQAIMQEMMKNMVKTCFDRCAGTSVRTT
jgi:Tim10/DDP family zinc finger